MDRWYNYTLLLHSRAPMRAPPRAVRYVLILSFD
jgi:hypothetical protein